MTRAPWVAGVVAIAMLVALIVAAERVEWTPALLAAAVAVLLLLDAVRAVTGWPELDANGPATVPMPAIERDPAPTPASAIERELERCRRHRRSCSVARVAGAPDHLRALAARVRRTDRVWAVGDDLVLLLPETDRVGATRAMTRLFEGVLLDTPAAVACFPQDALTAHALIEALRGRARPSSPADAAPVPARRLPPLEPAARLDTGSPS